MLDEQDTCGCSLRMLAIARKECLMISTLGLLFDSDSMSRFVGPVG